MLRLSLLGGFLIDGERSVSGRAAQRKRLACLALLGAAPGQSLSRDRIVGLLWPDSETERARHQLASSIYELRRALGADVLRSIGDDLRLNPKRITVDVAEFREALDRGELERAVGLYAGPFLNGFFVSGAAEFERWVETERSSLARGYRRAVEQLAEQREETGDVCGAVEWWSRLAADDPLCSRVVLRLMQALEAADDSAGALEQADRHARLLHEEFGACPEEEILRSAERLKGASTAIGTIFPPSPAVHAQTNDPSCDSEQVRFGKGPPEHENRRVAHSCPWPEKSWRESASRARRHPRVLLSVAALGLLAASSIWSQRAETHPPHVLDPNGVAVLSFADLSPNADQEYLADGIAEEILNTLAEVDGLKVVARTSSFGVVGSGRSPEAAGQRLGVKHILEGSVRSSGDSLRVTVRLADASTGFYQWSRVYDGTMSDLFTFQEQIAAAVASTLLPTVSLRAHGTLRQPRDLAAYNDYLRGRYFWNRRAETDLRKAIRHFEAAIARDSTFALAYAGLSYAYDALADYGRMRPRDAFAKARAAADRAVALDSTLAEGYVALAGQQERERNRPGAAMSYRRAIALNPNYATAHHWNSLLLAYTGRMDSALVEIERAQQLDPVSPVLSLTRGTMLYWSDRSADAVAELHRTLHIEPDFMQGYWWLGKAYLRQRMHTEALVAFRRGVEVSNNHPGSLAALAYGYAMTGQRDSALAIVHDLQQLPSEVFVSPARIALVQLGLGAPEAAIQGLQQADAASDGWLEYILMSPDVRPLRADPRIARIIERLGIHPPR